MQLNLLPRSDSLYGYFHLLHRFRKQVNINCESVTLNVRINAVHSVSEKMWSMKTMQSARLELRLAKQKKAFFEEVATLGGFKSLSDFIVHAADQQAIKIAEEHKKLLASEKDRKVFFDALMKPPKPNSALKKAFNRYNDILGTK